MEESERGISRISIAKNELYQEKKTLRRLS